MANSDKTLTIYVVAKDGTRQAFQQVSSEAASMGTAVQSASTKSAIALDELNKHAAAFGALMGTTLLRGLQAFTKASEENAAANALLRQAVENTGASFSTYSDAINKAENAANNLGFSNEASARSIQLLTSETGSVTKALSEQNLVMDLARSRSLSLEQSALLVAQALNGNIGALRRHGIMLDANATSEEALDALNKRVAGSAAAYADTTAGKLDIIREKWNNVEQAVGDALGPFQVVIGLLPGISAGMQLVAAAGGLVVDSMRAQSAASEAATAALEAQTAAEGEAALAETGMSLGLLGPIGLVAGLSAAAAYLLFFKGKADDYAKSVADAATATRNLADEIAGLQSGGQPGAAADATQVANQWKIAAANITLYKQLRSDIAASDYAQAAQDLYAGQVTAGQTPDSSGITNPEEKRVFDEIAALKQLQSQLADSGAAWDAFNASEQAVITNDIGKVFLTQGIDADAAKKAMGDLIVAFDSGKISAADFVKQMDEWATHAASDFPKAATSSVAAVNAITAQVTKLSDSLSADILNQALGGLGDKAIQDVIDLIGNSVDPLAKTFQSALANILADVAAGGKSAVDGYKDIIGLGDQFNGILDAEAKAASDAATGAENLSQAMYATAAAYAKASEDAHAFNVAMAEQKAMEGYQGQAATQFGPNSVGAEGSASAVNQVTTAANRATDAYNQMGTASIENGAKGSQAATEAAAAQTAFTNATIATDAALGKQAVSLQANFDAWQKTAIGYAQAVGQMPSLVDVLAQQQGPNKQLPMADQTFLTSLINVQSQVGLIDQALANGTITQDQYNLAQKTFNALSVDGAGDVSTLVTQLINVKGQYGVIDDLLHQHAITQEQYNELQKIGTEVLKEQSQVNFAVIAGMNQSTTVLGDMTRVVIDNTDAIGKSSDKLKTWADDLIGPVGTWAKIDQLQKDGRISLEEYNAAQWAQVEITQTNAKVQEDVQTIQVKQAPLLATLADDQERYLNYISELPAAQQLASLGFMDTTESMKAQSLVALASQAAMGQLGDTGEASARKIIQGAAEADPALKEMLKSMGLITIGTTGNIHVHFSDGDKTQKTLEAINKDLDEMVKIMGGVPDLKVNVDTKDAQANIDALRNKLSSYKDAGVTQDKFNALTTGGLSTLSDSTPISPSQVENVKINIDNAEAKQQLAELLLGLAKVPAKTDTKANVDNTTALTRISELYSSIGKIPIAHTTDINADASNGNAAVAGFDLGISTMPDSHDTAVTATVSGLDDVSNLKGWIDSLYDKTIYVNVATSVTGSGGAFLVGGGAQNGGVIQRHAVGGVASILAEAGPEWLDFPGGGHAMAMTKGMYSVPDGTYVHTAPATKAMGAGNSRPVQNYYAPIYITPASGSMQDSLNQSALNRHRRA